MSIKNKLGNLVTKTVVKVSSLAQATLDRSGTEKTVTSGMPELLREVAAQGAVLLKNDGTLPLKDGSRVSLFGRCSSNWFYVGYGSGGDVNNPYEVSLTEGIRNCDKLCLNEKLAKVYSDYDEENPINHGFWGFWPLCIPEMPLDNDTLATAVKESDVAVVTIGRSSGEDRDCKYKKGSYLLTEQERELLDKVTENFGKVVVLLNVGNIIDMSCFKDYGDKISALMYVWQGGMESGNAVADLLCGKVNPGGKLTSTLADNICHYPSNNNFGGKKYNEYSEDIYVGYRYFETFEPSQVLYPFGFGLSYTDFEVTPISTCETDSGFDTSVEVKNTGKYAGQETVQIYLQKPCGKLGNPKFVLTGFKKTKLLNPNEKETLIIHTDMYSLSSFDESGVTGYKSSYVLESGDYTLFAGTSVRDTEKVYTYTVPQTRLYEKLCSAGAPTQKFNVMKAEFDGSKYTYTYVPVHTREYSLKERILSSLPKEIPLSEDKGYKLADVKSGKVSIEEFTAQLSLDELEALSRGDYTMNSPLGAEGNASVYGGVLPSLREKGIPPVTTTDGPSGIRLKASCSLLPVGTLLACTYNTDLVQKLYSAVAKEMKDKGSDVLLAPGMNIHRHPLCGRNFEYLSEDPLVSGTIASAIVKGIQSQGASACPKHFACNSQEYKRNTNDSIVSERALREIYLKGFEICIKNSKPKNIMTSYNKINGVWGHYHYDLCTSILRKEWKYEGNVMTDWWMRPSKSPEFKNLKNQAYRVRAGVDVLMPGGDRVSNRKPDGTLLKTYGKKDGITLGEMQRTAINVLKSIIEIM